MNTKRFEMVLDFALNFKNDKSLIDKQVKELQSQFKSIEIDVDADYLKKQITGLLNNFDDLEKAGQELDKILNDLDFKLDTDEAREAIKVIEEQLKDINNIDLNILENAFDKLDLTDLDKVQSKLKELINNTDADVIINVEPDPKALAEIEKLKSKIDSIENKKAKLMLDTSGVVSQMSDISAEIAKLSKLDIDPQIKDEKIVALEKKFNALATKKAKLEIDSQQADGQIDKLQTKIQDIGKTTKVNISASGVDKFAQEFENARQEVEQLNDTQKKALAQMKLTGQQGSKEFKDLEKEIENTEKSMKEMAKASGELNNMTFTDKLAKFGEVSDGIVNMSDSMMTLTQPFVELDTATNRIKTLGGASKEAAPMLREMSLEMSKKMPIGAAAFQTATYDALSAGISSSKADIEAFMDASAKLAVGGGEEIGNTVNLLSSMVNAYGESATKTGEYSDIIFQTVNAGKTTVQELSGSLSNVIPTAAAYGWSLKNVGGALALMTSNGIPTAQATSKLNQLMLEMQKPGAELTTILGKAGVSVESLGAKVKSGDVIGALKDMDAAFKKSGKSATQAFSSAESGAAFNVLTKDFATLQNTMGGFDKASGSTQKAFDEMSGSLENRAKSLKATFDSFTIGAVDSLGGVGTGLAVMTQSLGQMQGPITALAGMSTLFGGMPAKVLDTGKAILTKLIPGLITQTAAQEGATMAQTKFNVAALANPYIIAAAAIAGIVLSIKAISAALYETAQESLDNAKAQDQVIGQQIKLKQSQIDLAQSNQNLVSQFKNTGASAMENKDLMLKLAQAYPGVIDVNKSYEQNLKALEAQSGKTGVELTKLKGELFGLAQQKIDIQIKMANIEINVEKQKIEDTLQGAFGNFADDVDDYILGSSGGRMKAEKLIKPYMDAIYAAKNDKQLQEASLAFQMAVVNGDGGFATLDDATKKTVSGMVESVTKSKSAALVAAKKAVAENYQAMVISGKSEAEIINFISKQYGVSKEEAKGMVTEQKESKKVTVEQKTEVQKLADAWNAVKTAAQTSLNEQKGAYLQQQKEINDIKKKKPAEITADDQKKLDDWNTNQGKLLKNMKDKNNEIKTQNKQEENLNKYIDPPVTAKKALLELIKEEIALKNGTLDIEKMIYDAGLKAKLVKEDREATSAELLAQEQNTLKTYENQRDVLFQTWKDNKLININDKGEIEFVKKSAKEIQDIESKKKTALADLDKKFKKGEIATQEEYLKQYQDTTEKYNDMTLKIKAPDKQEFQKATIDANNKVLDTEKNINAINLKAKIDTKELAKSVMELDLSKIEYEMEIGIRPKGDYTEIINMYKDLGVKLQSELDEINSKFSGDERVKKATEKEKEILENKKTIWGYDLKELEKKFDKENTLRENDSEKLDAKLEKDLAKTQKFIDTWSKSSTKKLDTDYSKDTDNLDSALEYQQSLLEKSKEEGYLTEEDFTRKSDALQAEFDGKKRDREEKYRRDKLRLENVNAGLLEEQERRNAVAKLEREKADLMEQIKQAVAMGDTNKADELKAQLDETEKILKEKGDVLAQLADGMGGAINDSITSMFAGDEEGAIDSMRAYFARLAGELKGLLSAFVLKTVLSKGTLKYLDALPFPLNVAAIPVITGAVNAGISAIADPIINELLSFATGGDITGLYTKPTAIVLGDAAKLGGRNREWVANDDNIREIVNMANSSGNSALAQELRDIKILLASQELFTDIKGTDLRLSQRRTGLMVNNRAR